MKKHDLINRTRLLEIYKQWLPQLESPEDAGDRQGVETCIIVLEDMPSINAVEVIRCKNCNWYDVESENCKFWDGYRDPEHFCGEGICGGTDA